LEGDRSSFRSTTREVTARRRREITQRWMPGASTRTYAQKRAGERSAERARRDGRLGGGRLRITPTRRKSPGKAKERVFRVFPGRAREMTRDAPCERSEETRRTLFMSTKSTMVTSLPYRASAAKLTRQTRPSSMLRCREEGEAVG
jgi:hypothetical protein